MLKLIQSIFGSANDRILKTYSAIVPIINGYEDALKQLSDEALRGKTAEFKHRLANGSTLDELLPEAFAVCREGSRRALNMRHFDVQLIGGMALHNGKIAEMKTGEGKTLVATLPVYLNALTGKGVHVVTVNDYLARRDAEWMGRLYQFLGLTVGVVSHGFTDAQKFQAYRCDICYGTNSEFGFDYLRDNMKFSVARMAQRELNFAIVDEVDSILIDEARTPLIISGPSDPSTDKYVIINAIIPLLKAEEHYKIDEKARSAMLTEAGVTAVEKQLNIDNLYDPKHIESLHHVTQALKAHTLFKRDVDYVVKDGEVQIVDEFTGRILPGRRWSDGLHQAVEAKEGVAIENENQTLATVTYQNFFRMYKKLAGMTGTADTEAPEFLKIYNLGVVVIPPNRINQRKDLNDVVYKNENAKFKALVDEVRTEHAKGRPILIGTIAIEKSEKLSRMLERAGIRHNVLNAKHHEREAEIIAQAGRYGSVTVSTNMAGRGTDILLGGNPEFLARAKADPDANPVEYHRYLAEFREGCQAEQKKVIELGGLYVMGTERHESRRIDNQLRGRTGRQGDPGQSRFFISLEDDLMRIFGSERIQSIMSKLGMGEDEVIEHPWINKAIASAQKKVEAHHFDMRKNVLEYDDVMNQQRQTIYTLRKKILGGEALWEELTDRLDDLVAGVVDRFGPNKQGEYDRVAFVNAVEQYTGVNYHAPESATADDLGHDLYGALTRFLEAKRAEVTPSVFDQTIKFFLLQTLDDLWKEHLLTMDHLRQGIGLRGYGQKDPKQEYKREGFEMFQAMLMRVTEQALEKIFKVQIKTEDEVQIREQPEQKMTMSHGEQPVKAASKKNVAPVRNIVPRVGRNEPCPCGSGKKFKSCHGAEVGAA